MIEDSLGYLSFVSRMEKWLVTIGVSAEDALKCTQYVESGDPIYLVYQEGEKNQATDATCDLKNPEA